LNIQCLQLFQTLPDQDHQFEGQRFLVLSEKKIEELTERRQAGGVLSMQSEVKVHSGGGEKAGPRMNGCPEGPKTSGFHQHLWVQECSFLEMGFCVINL
jgi:hypothetical protein